MAAIQVEISFDDKAVEKDFFEVISSQNPQALIDSVGGDSVAKIQAITDDDKKNFVIDQMCDQLLQAYLTRKHQIAAAEAQAKSIADNQNKLTFDKRSKKK